MVTHRRRTVTKCTGNVVILYKSEIRSKEANVKKKYE